MYYFMKKNRHALKMALAATALTGSFNVSAGIDAYLGELTYGAWNFEPKGTAFCDGRLLQISTNTALFALLGTNYGGDGIRTFALPDLRGRFPMHQGNGPGLTPHVIGEMAGSESVVLNSSNLPAHTHAATTTVTATAHASNAQASTATATAGVWATTGRNNTYNTATPNVDMEAGAVTATASTTVFSSGSSNPTPVSILPPYTVVNCVINMVGVFPSRN